MRQTSDEGLRTDILLLLHREGPLTGEILIRRLGVDSVDHLDWNLKRLKELVTCSENRLELTEAGKNRVEYMLAERS